MQIWNECEEFFCSCFNLSNNNLISALKARSENGYGFKRSGRKTGVENDIFWSEIGSGFEEPDGTPPLRIPSSYTPPFEQLAPAVNNNGTSHMEKEPLVSVSLYLFEHLLISFKHIYWMVVYLVYNTIRHLNNWVLQLVTGTPQPHRGFNVVVN